MPHRTLPVARPSRWVPPSGRAMRTAAPPPAPPPGAPPGGGEKDSGRPPPAPPPAPKTAGNHKPAGPTTATRVERNPPAVNCGTADPLWHAADVGIACTATDGGSGLASPADA